jgi:DNA-binding transcriptional LysR family regulator
MTLEQLRIFVAVAEREHVTAAARALNITQSAASAAIAALERRHATVLFHRVGRGIALTESGRAFLEEARGVLARATAADLMLQEFGELQRGSLRLVASQTTAAYWLPAKLAAFRKRYPQLAIELAIGNTEQAAEKVSDGQADLGIVEGKIDNAMLAQWPLGEDRLVVVSATPAPSKTIGKGWLRQVPWVMREQGSGTRSTFNESIRRLGVDPETLNIALVLPSNESVRAAVEAGGGVAALSWLVVGPAVQAGRLHALPVDLGRRLFFGLRHKERYRTKAAEAFLELIAEDAKGEASRRSTKAKPPTG